MITRRDGLGSFAVLIEMMAARAQAQTPAVIPSDERIPARFAEPDDGGLGGERQLGRLSAGTRRLRTPSSRFHAGVRAGRVGHCQGIRPAGADIRSRRDVLRAAGQCSRSVEERQPDAARETAGAQLRTKGSASHDTCLRWRFSRGARIVSG